MSVVNFPTFHSIADAKSEGHSDTPLDVIRQPYALRGRSKRPARPEGSVAQKLLQAFGRKITPTALLTRHRVSSC